MSHSFVQRAPAIAEEILAKTASLPESLKSFTKSLLSKEASVDERDRLELPKRMTLGDLSKIAHENKVDLPKVQDVKVDDYTKIASELVAIAKRGEQEEANEVFASASAIVAANHEKVSAAGIKIIRTPTPSFWTRTKAKVMGPESPAGFTTSKWKAEERAQVAAREARIPDPTIEAETRSRAHDLAVEKAKGETRRSALEHAPAIGLAVGTPLAAAALLSNRGGGKKEEVKIYK